MDTNPRYTLVGVIVLILIAALVFWISWLWRGDTKEKNALFAIHFNRQSLSGLQVDSNVTMRGIKVGSVTTIAIQPQDIERVRVTIALYLGTPVRTDTRAVIARNLLTGIAGIDLVGSTQAAQPLTFPSHGDSLPVIGEGETGLDKVQQTVPELMGKASISLDKLGLLLSDENIANFSKTLQNVETGSEALARLGGVLNSTEKVFDGFSSLFAESKGKIAPTLDNLSVTMKEIRTSTVKLSSDLAALLRSAAVTSDKLKEPRSAVLGLPSGKLGPGEQKVP